MKWIKVDSSELWRECPAPVVVSVVFAVYFSVRMGVLVLSENGLLHHLLRQEALHHPRNLCQKSFCSIARADLLPTSPRFATHWTLVMCNVIVLNANDHAQSAANGPWAVSVRPFLLDWFVSLKFVVFVFDMVSQWICATWHGVTVDLCCTNPPWHVKHVDKVHVSWLNDC